jgi:hypothetical protein
MATIDPRPEGLLQTPPFLMNEYNLGQHVSLASSEIASSSDGGGLLFPPATFPSRGATTQQLPIIETRPKGMLDGGYRPLTCRSTRSRLLTGILTVRHPSNGFARPLVAMGIRSARLIAALVKSPESQAPPHRAYQPPC